MNQTAAPTIPPSAEALTEARRLALESEAAGNAALPDTAAPQADPAAGAGNAVVDERHAREQAIKPQKSPADLAREAIGSKYRESRGRNPDSSEQALTDGVNRMMSEAEGRPFDQSQPTDASTVAQRTAPARAPSAAPAASDQPLAKPADMVTIIVEGRQVAVPASEIWRQGVAAAQKLSTADARLERASQAERSLIAERQAIDSRAAEIRAATPAGVAQAARPTSLPTGGKSNLEATKQALNALLDSDVDGAAQALDRIVTEQVDARLAATRASASPTPAPQSDSAVHPARLEEPWTVAQREEANAEFLRTHSDIAYNPELMAVAVQRMRVEMDNPANRAAKADLGRIVLRIGSEMTRDLASRGSSAPQPSPSDLAPQPRSASTVDELAARRQLAARVPGIPPSATARTVTAAPSGPTPPTRSEAVQAMRRSRGQPV